MPDVSDPPITTEDTGPPATCQVEFSRPSESTRARIDRSIEMSAVSCAAVESRRTRELSTVVLVTWTPALSRVVVVIRYQFASRVTLSCCIPETPPTDEKLIVDMPMRGTERINMLVESSGTAVTLA